jgi:uncharacterized membrane protein
VRAAHLDARNGVPRSALPRGAADWWRRRSVPLLALAAVLAFAGLGVATYLSVTHATGQPIACSGVGDCGYVNSSEYAKVAGVPVAALGAAAYACVDVLVQKWSPVWGAGRFVPIVMACAAVYSLPLHRFDAPRRTSGEHTSPAYTPWVTGGAVCLAVQGLMFISSISIYRQATSANVLYSSRGLWSVVAVWGIGHWFTNREQHLGARVLAWRLVGAILLMAALLMVLLDDGG